MEYSLVVNGRRRRVAVEPGTPLLWVLRDALGLTGTKYGCGRALCGACTVHVGGGPVRACALPIELLGEREVVTIEGLGESRIGRAVQEAWIARDVVQCGWCQPGQCMSAAALLGANPAPDEQAIDHGMAGNLCRCGTYPRIRAAIHAAARALAGQEGGR